MRRVRVGDVLQLQRRAVSIDPATEYRLIGVYSFGKGIFHREPKIGAELGNYKFFAVEPGDLVLSNIQAWEGAIGFATEADRGTVGTHRFLAYTAIDPDEIDTNWARYFFLSEAGFPLIQKAAPGSVTRNRTLAVERFEALEIPLPDIDEQRRTAAQLDEMRLRVERLRVSSSSATSGSAVLGDKAIQRIIETGVESGWAVRPLADVSAVNPGRKKVSADEIVSFVPMSALDDRTGRITQPQSRRAGDIGSGYKQFTRGDVIFARITPCMQNGKCAVVGDELPFVGYGSTEFHVVRPGPEIESRWLHAVLRSRGVRDLAAEHFTGTAGQQRVPASFLENLPIPVPPGVAAQREALEEIERAVERSLRLRSLGEHRGELVEALVPSALNTAFAGLA